MNPLPEEDYRVININFEAYGDDDPQFKVELIALMMDNIHELLYSADKSFSIQNPQIFKSTVHKTRSTIKLLEDEIFTALIDQLRDSLLTNDHLLTSQRLTDFKKFANYMLKSLERETARLKN